MRIAKFSTFIDANSCIDAIFVKSFIIITLAKLKITIHFQYR